MNYKYFLSLSIFAFFFLSGYQSLAQDSKIKKVKGMPVVFIPPYDYYSLGMETVNKNLISNTVAKSNEIPWSVISDREDNILYEEPNESSKVAGKMAFKKKVFYVVEEKGEWIRIARAKIEKRNSLKCSEVFVIGWVKRSNMLLWSSGLVDKNTKINRKAFLLKKLDNVNELMTKADNLKVSIYKDPYGKVKGDPINIYDFYFVMKKEGPFYLLSEEDQINRSNNKKIIGWVREADLENWDTRISLEPNFESNAFNERKNNPELQCKAFGSYHSVPNYVKGKEASGVLWKSDPVLYSKAEMAKSNPNRWPGNVIRFPMFDKRDKENVYFYKSGVIGNIKILKDKNGKLSVDSDIKEMDMAQINRKVSQLKSKNQNLNIFFVIEGTSSTNKYQTDIVEMIQTLKVNSDVRDIGNVKYGALIYRDIMDKEKIYDYVELSADISKVKNFVAKENTFDCLDEDPYSAMYYGLKEGLTIAGMKKEAINVVIMIGSNADFRSNKSRRDAAKSNNDESLISSSAKAAMFKDMADFDVHLYSIQLFNDGISYGNKYCQQVKALMQQAAKTIYIAKSNSPITKSLEMENKMNLESPTIGETYGETFIELKSSKPGFIIKPKEGSGLSKSEIIAGVNKMVSKSIRNELLIQNAIVSMYVNGDSLNIPKYTKDGSISAASFTSEILDFLTEIEESGIENDVIVKSTETKLSLYQQVYLPVKMDKAEHPMFSYVLFMPEKDLDRYQKFLQHQIDEGNLSEPSNRRKTLHSMYIAMTKEFVGEEFEKSAENWTPEQLLERIQGIEDAGLELGAKLNNLQIQDIKNEKKVSNEEITEMIDRFTAVNKGLISILKKNRNYDFCFSTDNYNYYYWIRIDQFF